MKTIHIFTIFIIVVLIQLFIPSQMIFNQEQILKKGKVYKFKTQPVDPTDPFKGKYINLNYEIDSYKTNDSLWQRHEEIYVYLTKDSLGFAKIDTIARTLIPNNNNDYIKTKAGWYSNYTNKLSVEFSFNRYYMEETKAYDAEIAVRNRQRDSLPNNTYALVYVKNGEVVLNDVIIDEISIKDYVEKEKPQ
ncbi:GDYXXLXY domain-containing protein [Flavivirga spongiicola]|uniref:GDYXXLXY domain-containing protein n=1 Tax=Flavivirga spongiicola TaxID=421621 RepID=A0ABU7XVE8_9FLAO|nr:GDYXXLXY domain-containing protein [Flavivirga sp. MEBiC05379]MDO5979750.1 GDYXXLXY domain-containing protein [Flavivirga sp. MEBiC05379]